MPGAGGGTVLFREPTKVLLLIDVHIEAVLIPLLFKVKFI